MSSDSSSSSSSSSSLLYFSSLLSHPIVRVAGAVVAFGFGYRLYRSWSASSASSTCPNASADLSSSSSTFSPSVAFAQKHLLDASAVCFDVDSTVVTEEGINVLAEYCGKGPEVSAWTAKAMNGNVLFEDALSARLDLIRPSRHDVTRLLKQHPLVLTPGIKELVQLLHQRKVEVYLVSGGFRQMILDVAALLKIPPDHVYANVLLFHDGTGAYVDFDRNQPTAKSGGKAEALKRIQRRPEMLARGAGAAGSLIMIGDGVTDLEAKPPAHAFIGYGGIAVRDAVKRGADWFVTDFRPLITLLTKPKSSSSACAIL